MNRPIPRLARLWMYLCDESEEIGDRVVVLLACGAILLWAVGVIR